jgi:hypothetical protein
MSSTDSASNVPYAGCASAACSRHVNFGKPNSSYLANGFGIINGYAGGYGPRQIQVGLKFYY